MRIAVTGHKGQIATALLEKAHETNVEIFSIGRPELDMAEPSSIRHMLKNIAVDAIVSAAAYTAVDRAENEPETAFAVNAEGAGAVAEVAASLDIPILHLSTDYVFSGDKTSNYEETDAPAPLSVYGRSKLAGEQHVAQIAANHAIIRTSWVYSPFGANFVKTMLRLAETRNVLRVVDDQIGSPTSALDIAGALLAIAQRLVGDTDPALRGVFHMTGTGRASWADFATEIFATLKNRTGRTIIVERIGTSDYPTAARRPLNSLLSNEKLKATYEIILPDWRTSTRIVTERILDTEGEYPS